MHLAALANTKTVGLFGPSNVNKYGPWGEKTFAFQEVKVLNNLWGIKTLILRKMSV